MTILKLAENIRSISKSKSNIIFQELPSDDPLVRKPDITNAKSVIDWEPKVGFEEGIDKTIKFFRKKINK